MRVEVRADGTHVTGYVNVTGKKSRPIVTPRGKVVEVIEERAFAEALAKAKDVTLLMDHDPAHAYASTAGGTLKLREDSIGLYADALLDKSVNAKELRGWSFGMTQVKDELEERENDIPIRHVKGFELDHVSLVKSKTPCYAATSVEVRAGSDVELETRCFENEVEVFEQKEKVDYGEYEKRLAKIKKER